MLIGTSLLPNNSVLITEVSFGKREHHIHSWHLLPEMCFLSRGVWPVAVISDTWAIWAEFQRLCMYIEFIYLLFTYLFTLTNNQTVEWTMLVAYWEISLATINRQVRGGGETVGLLFTEWFDSIISSFSNLFGPLQIWIDTMQAKILLLNYTVHNYSSYSDMLQLNL